MWPRRVERKQLDWAAIFLVAIAARLAYWFVSGTRVVGDANGALRFCEMASIGELVAYQHTVVYSGFQLPYCGFLSATGGFVDGWVILQVVLSALSCVLLYETGRLLVDRTAGLVAGFSFALVWEVFHWVVRPMSEPIFTIVAVVVLWRLAVYETNPTGRNRALAAGVLLYLALTRPNGLPIVAGYLLWDTLFESDESRLGVFPRRSINVALIGLLGVLAVYRLLDDGAFLPVQRWARGLVVTGHVYYDYTPVATESALSFVLFNVHHIVIISALRVAWFFSPVLPGWSTPHVVLSLVTLLPLILGGLVGSYSVFREERVLFKLWVTPVVMIVLTAMLLWVAGSRNFLGPAVASFALLSGYLVSDAIHRVSLSPVPGPTPGKG